MAPRAVAAGEGGVFSDDSVAILLQSDPCVDDHFQFALSASGARFDQVAANTFKDTKGFSPEWVAATRVDGGVWTGEIALPLSIFAGLGEFSGLRWKVNFGRHTHDGENSAWQTTRNWHATRDYGWVEFE